MSGNGFLGPIRIRMLEMPRLLRELIELAVRAQPDMELVDADSPPPDFVVCGVPSAQSPSAGRSLLAERARVRVLELDPDAGRASLYELHEHAHEIGEVSPAEIVDKIRSAARRAE
jgi:hypothetical protein